jgi:hypothetical protein
VATATIQNSKKQKDKLLKLHRDSEDQNSEKQENECPGHTMKDLTVCSFSVFDKEEMKV